jgi:hypothetical protein
LTRTVSVLRVVLCAFLLVWEPLNFASEALSALPTISARGALAMVELAGHAVIAMFTVAAAVALRSKSPHGVKLAVLGTAASTARTLQVLRFSMLPHDTSPDLAPLFTVAALANALFWSAFLTRYEDQLTDHRP